MCGKGARFREVKGRRPGFRQRGALWWAQKREEEPWRLYEDMLGKGKV